MSVTEVCRLCPNKTSLLHVFDGRLSNNNNMNEVIYVTSGIKIEPTDIVSQKVCSRCCKITLKMFQFRQDAMKQDRSLKEQCEKLLSRGMKLPKTNIIIKKDKPTHNDSKTSTTSTTSSENTLGSIHSSITNLFRQYPSLKLPKKCFSDDMNPSVSIELGKVERYFRKRKIDMMKYVYRPISSNKVAKKRTTVPPMKEKSVAPLRISRKILENDENLPLGELKKNVPKVSGKTRDRKRRRSSSTETTQSSSSMENRISNDRRRHKKSSEPRNLRRRIATLSTSSSNNNQEDYMSEDTRQEPTSKPAFIETLGLTPTPTMSSEVPATMSRSRPLYICNTCSSVQYSSTELKRHSYKHMVCQFCKHKFHSIEAKDKHIENDCDVKKMMNSERCTVILEKVDSVLDIRRKYRETFERFALIPGLNDPQPVEEIILAETDMISGNEDGDVIVLSDEDDEQRPLENKSHENDPLGVTQPSNISIDKSSGNWSNIAYTRVSIVTPDVRIKNNSVFNQINSETSDTHVISQLLNIMKAKKVAVKKMVQTDLPGNKDIKTNCRECTSELSNLKMQLRVFKIPIEMKKGPFSVNYGFRENVESKKGTDLWYNIPITDYEPSTSQYSKQHIPCPATNNPSVTLQQNTQNNCVNGTLANPNLTRGNHVPIISTANSTGANLSSLSNADINTNLISTHLNQSPVLLTSSNTSFPVSNSNPLPTSSSCSVPPLIQLSATNMPGSTMSAPLPINPTNVVTQPLNVNANNALNGVQCPPTQPIPGFRVKNVWELQ